jgi:hypothetical protein
VMEMGTERFRGWVVMGRGCICRVVCAATAA